MRTILFSLLSLGACCFTARADEPYRELAAVIADSFYESWMSTNRPALDIHDDRGTSYYHFIGNTIELHAAGASAEAMTNTVYHELGHWLHHEHWEDARIIGAVAQAIREDDAQFDTRLKQIPYVNLVHGAYLLKPWFDQGLVSTNLLPLIEKAEIDRERLNYGMSRYRARGWYGEPWACAVAAYKSGDTNSLEITMPATARAVREWFEGKRRGSAE